MLAELYPEEGISILQIISLIHVLQQTHLHLHILKVGCKFAF